MEQSHDFSVSYEQHPSPTLLAYTRLLELPAWKLEQTIQYEVSQNPALELTEQDTCKRCGSVREDGICFYCLERAQEYNRSLLYQSERAHNDDEDFDVFAVVAAPRPLNDMLLEDVRIILPSDLHGLAEYIIGNLDTHGFLSQPIGTMMRALSIERQPIADVIDALRQVGPVGIASRDPEECLQLQLESMDQNGLDVSPLVRTLIMERFDDLGHGRYTEIALQLGVRYQDVLKARDYIRVHFQPYPVSDTPESAQGAVDTSDTAYVSPDVRIAYDSATDSFFAEVPESQRARVHVATIYRELGKQVSRGTMVDIAPGDREHILGKLRQAQQFISYLTERGNTLERVCRVVIGRQDAFLRHGVRELCPLTRVEVAQVLNVDNSTVSRAVSDKYVLLPSGEVAPFSIFFEPSRSAQDVLRELILSEKPPLTDSELSDRMKSYGFPVARRTVAKYRKSLGIMSSRFR